MWQARKLQALLYELYARYAILIGVSSYRYSFKSGLYESTLLSEAIAAAANLVVLIFMPATIWDAWRRGDEQDLAYGICSRLEATVNGCICVLRVLLRPSRERHTRAVVLELRRMQRIYRYHCMGESEELQRLHRLYLMKNIVIWALPTVLVCFFVLVRDQYTAYFDNLLVEAFYIVIYSFTIGGQYATMHLHFLLSWRICYLYKSLNQRVNQLLQPDVAAAEATRQLHHLRWQHAQLAGLLQRLNVAYNLLMTSARFSLLITAAALSFYVAFFPEFKRLLHFQIIGIGVVALPALDTYILDQVYDKVMQCYSETSFVLKARNELRPLPHSVPLDRACELFALQIANFPLKISPYGLFTSGKATWLSNICCILGWMIVLLQFRIGTNVA